MLRDELHRHRDAIAAIAERHGASNLRLFGSVGRGEERADSDIDLLVDLADNAGFGDYLALVEELEACSGGASILWSGAASARISAPSSRLRLDHCEERRALSRAHRR